MTNLTDSTKITVQVVHDINDVPDDFDADDAPQTTWGEFKTVNADDPEMLRDIEAQIAENNYAEVGGGAQPLFWIFA